VFVAAIASSARPDASGPSLSGVIETYFSANQEHRGFVQQFTWSELDLRVSDHWKATASYLLSPSNKSFDEAYIQYQEGPNSIRAGRIRTEFGFSDWSELFYNGFNHLPLVRVVPLAGNLSLTRDDAGAEGTAKIGRLQLQVSAIDPAVGRDQLSPDSISYSTARLQGALERLLVGVDYLSKLAGGTEIYGIDARYTVPHWLFRGEAFKGSETNSGSGYYIDAVYRIPSLTRTELVGRIEEASSDSSPQETHLRTLGVRQIINRFFTFNLNYGWGSGIDEGSYAYSQGLAGWTARAMFQLQLP
jgi:hypothetical protein